MVPQVAVLKDVGLSNIELIFFSIYYIAQGKIWIIEVQLCGQKTDDFFMMLGIAARATFESFGKLDTSPSCVQTPSQICFMAFCCYAFI